MEKGSFGNKKIVNYGVSESEKFGNMPCEVELRDESGIIDGEIFQLEKGKREMKLGVCTGPENMELAAKAGFDYVEWNMAMIAGLSEEEFQAIMVKKPDFPIPVLACNGFLPGNVKVTGPEACAAQQEEYLERALSRANALGVKTVVFGSGAARGVPEGFSHPEAWRQIAAFLKLVAKVCDKYDIVIAIEPLRRQECNILNYVSEGVMMSALVNHPRIGVLGDTFHMLCGSEPWSALKQAGERLKHVHISHELPDLGSRTYPSADDGSDYETIFRTLKEMGYQGGVSIEAGTDDFERDVFRAAACLKPLAY